MELQRHLISFATDLVGLAAWLVLLSIVFVPLERIFGNRAQRYFAGLSGRICFIIS
jgi:hypothetical protein